MTRTIDPGLVPRYYKIMNGRLDTEELYSAHDAELLLKTVKPGETSGRLHKTHDPPTWAGQFF